LSKSTLNTNVLNATYSTRNQGRKSPELDGIIHQDNAYRRDPAVVKIGDVGGSIEAKASAQQGHYDESIPEREEWLGEIPIFFVGLFRYGPDSFIGDNREETTFVFGDWAGDDAENMVRLGEVGFVWEKWGSFGRSGVRIVSWSFDPIMRAAPHTRVGWP